MNSKSRGLLWVLSVIVAFIIGYLLARRMCPDRITSSGAGSACVPSGTGRGAGVACAAAMPCACTAGLTG